MSDGNTSKNQDRAKESQARQQSKNILDMLVDAARNVGAFLEGIWDGFIEHEKQKSPLMREMIKRYGRGAIDRFYGPAFPFKKLWDYLHYDREEPDKYIATSNNSIPASLGWPNAQGMKRGYQIADSLMASAKELDPLGDYLYTHADYLRDAQPYVWDEFVQTNPSASPDSWPNPLQRRLHAEALTRKSWDDFVEQNPNITPDDGLTELAKKMIRDALYRRNMKLAIQSWDRYVEQNPDVSPDSWSNKIMRKMHREALQRMSSRKKK